MAPQFTIAPLPVDVRASMTGKSWREGVPVSLDALALVTVARVGFDGGVHDGRIVVAQSDAAAVMSAFAAMFAARYPIERMDLVDAYDADDDRSMTANNTSGFNGRPVAGTTRWSQHAYGLAVDVNPAFNPWLHDGRIDPPNAAAYVDRASTHPAVIREDSVVVRAFEAIGWFWGGRWPSPDWHHFEKRQR